MSARDRNREPPSPEEQPSPGPLFRMRIEQMPAVLWTIDRELRITASMGAGLANLGLRSGQVVGQSLYDYFQTTDPDFLPIAAARRALAGESVTYEMTWQGRTFQVHMEPFVDDQGRSLGSIGVAFDITERKQAEQALRDLEERHRLIAELTSDYAYTCVVHTDGRVVLDSVTEGFFRVLSYTLEEVEARGGWASFIHPDDLPGVMARMPRLLAGERDFNELRVITKSGDTRWVRYSTQPILDPGQGRVIRLVGAVQDITERKQAQEALEGYAQRLQALSRRLLEVQEQERRHLARELHDEIGQLLTGLQLSLERCSRVPADQLRPCLDEARALARDLTAQVRDLSLWLRPTMLDDLGLLPALVWQLRRYTEQTGIHVAFEHRGLERRFQPAEVETAAYRIVQEALTNVARHAGVGEAVVRIWLDRGRLCVQIEDRGVGFRPEAMPAEGGSSGLSGMKERAELLGGQLVVEAAPGHGARVTAELPVHLPEEAPCH